MAKLAIFLCLSVPIILSAVRAESDFPENFLDRFLEEPPEDEGQHSQEIIEEDPGGVLPSDEDQTPEPDLFDGNSEEGVTSDPYTDAMESFFRQVSVRCNDFEPCG